MKHLGIDIGTTNICMLLADSDGKIIKTVTAPNTANIPSKPYEKLQNPDIIVRTCLEMLDDFIGYSPDSIGIDGQMHGMLYVDENGNALSELAIWMDSRGNLPYKNGTYASCLSEITGCKMSTGFGLTTHYYNVINNSVPQKAKKICTIHDYLVMRLCSLNSPLMHTSDAASFGCFDINSGKFMLDKLENAGIDTDILPDVTDEYKIAGYYKNIPVCVAIGDNQASFIGAGGNEKAALLNYGTGSQVSMITDATVSTANAELRPLGNGKNIMVGCSLCGGRAYSVLSHFFADVIKQFTGQECKDIYRTMDSLFDDKNDMKMSTLFAGTRNDPEKRGAISNISEGNFTAANLVGSCIHGMCDEIYEYYGEMFVFRQNPLEYLIGSGNGIRKNLPLQKVIEETYGLPLKIPANTEEAAFGAALCGAVAAQIYPDLTTAIDNTVKYI